MIRIVAPQNCGNSPKNAFIEQFAADLLGGREPLPGMAKDAEFLVRGLGRPCKPNELGALLQTQEGIQEARLGNAVSHGKKGAIDVDLVRANGSLLSLGLFMEFASLKADSVALVKLIFGGS